MDKLRIGVSTLGRRIGHGAVMCVPTLKHGITRGTCPCFDSNNTIYRAYDAKTTLNVCFRRNRKTKYDCKAIFVFFLFIKEK